MRVVTARSPASVTVDFDAIPDNDMDALCRTVIFGAGRYMQDPNKQKEYERWKAARQNKENTNEKVPAQASH